MPSFEITGQPTIVPCTTVARLTHSWTILIMGPTGAGKSTFIEALAGAGQSLGISKDQLAGFTQNISCYELKNAVVNSDWSGSGKFQIYLVDTPGFSDSKISEMEIINQLKGWMKDQGVGINSILYLSPITDTRVPGSKRRTIKMLQSLLQDGSASKITIVTTMWDRVSNAAAEERAEAHFVQLYADIWKDVANKGAQVAKFRNYQESAIGIIRDAINSDGNWYIIGDIPVLEDAQSGLLLYQELLERISNLCQEIESLRFDLLQLIANPNPPLKSLLVPRLLEVRQDLTKFLGQLVGFGDPPPGFGGVPEQVVCQHLLDHVKNTQQEIAAFQNAKMRVRKFMWIQRSNMTTAIRKAELRLSELSMYLDASGSPRLPSGCDGLMEVLEFLRPTVEPTSTQRVKDAFTSWMRSLRLR